MGVSPALVRELDAVGDWGLVTTDAELVVTSLNPWLERRAGRSADTVVGRPLFEAFPELVVRRLDRFYRQAIQGRTSVLSQRLHKYVLLLPLPLADARFDCMQQSARIIPIVDGDKITGTVTVIDDVTERVGYEAELSEQVAALRRADQAKDEFLAMLAHELRNPLAPIRNAAYVLQQLDSTPPPALWCIDVIARQTDQLTRLVDDLLDVSRISSGKISLRRQIVDLRTVVRQAFETNRPFIDARSHEVRLSLPNEAVQVDGDHARLVQIVSNLINNAVKYTDEHGTILVSLKREGRPRDGREEAVISVRDNGRGIDPAVLANLFDLFFQADVTLERADGGLGVGLSLVKSLVALHDGSIEARSEGKGLGSEFVVRFPVAVSVPLSPAADSAGPAVKPTSILVVDDNLDSAESMAALLRLDGHEVVTAHDGRRAVEIALRERPAVVLLDLKLPQLNGYEACQRIRDGGLTDALIVAMTGFGADEDNLRSLESRFDAHEVKPVDLASLRRLLASRTARPR